MMVASKRIMPTVVPKAEVIDLQAIQGKGTRITIPKGGALPPIGHIKPPDMKHMSTRIRWFLGLGYTVKEVSAFLGVRYQQVRNVGTQSPKRAAREDVPPYIIELWEVDDDLEAMEAHALEQQMAAQREQDREARRQSRKGVGPQRLDLEVGDK